MKRPANLSLMKTEELVRLFEGLCVSFGIAIDQEKVRTFRRHFDAILAVEMELKGRPGDQRRALKVLLGKGNLQVRVTAAKALLVVDRAAAIRELKEVKALNWLPQSAEAGMTLDHLASGFYVPS